MCSFEYVMEVRMKHLFLLLLGVAACSFFPCEAKSHINQFVVHRARKPLLRQRCSHCDKVNDLYARDLDDHNGRWRCKYCGKWNP